MEYGDRNTVIEKQKLEDRGWKTATEKSLLQALEYIRTRKIAATEQNSSISIYLYSIILLNIYPHSPIS